MCSVRTGLSRVRRYRLAVGLAPVAAEGLTPTSNRRYESKFTAVVLPPQIRTAMRSFGAGW